MLRLYTTCSTPGGKTYPHCRLTSSKISISKRLLSHPHTALSILPSRTHRATSSGRRINGERVEEVLPDSEGDEEDYFNHRRNDLESRLPRSHSYPDEDIDSDEAFEESDNERFAGFSFSSNVCLIPMLCLRSSSLSPAEEEKV